MIAGRGSFYWETVAGAFVSNGRSFAQLLADAKAGIERYLIEAVIEEHTTEICRFLNGKAFTVSTGLQTFERVESERDDVKEITPCGRRSIRTRDGRCCSWSVALAACRSS